MGSYSGYFIKWLTDLAAAAGEWFAEVGWKITHDPLWGGITIGIVAVLVILFFVKRKASGGK